MVTETDVIMAYRLLLGREPENQQVITGQAEHFKTVAELRADFMASPEFLAKSRIPIVSVPDAGIKTRTWPPIAVDIDCPQANLQHMLSRVEQTFLELGRTEPHWSVLSEDRFRAENIVDHENAFYASGEFPLSGLRQAAARSKLDLAQFQTCFELGCGMGRSTLWLAREFPQVIGADVSSIHLDHARASAPRFGLNNIAFMHLNQIDQYQSLPDFDLFFSIIVLQNNPPPLIAFVLEAALNKLAPGGIAYFQVPTYIVNYGFSAADYVDTPPPDDCPEVHCLPQAELFEILERTGCRVLEIREDGTAGAFAISNVVLARKQDRPDWPSWSTEIESGLQTTPLAENIRQGT